MMDIAIFIVSLLQLGVSVFILFMILDRKEVELPHGIPNAPSRSPRVIRRDEYNRKLGRDE